MPGLFSVENDKAVRKDCCSRDFMYEGHSEMIWTHLVRSNFIVFSLNTKQLLVQRTALLGYTSVCCLVSAIFSGCMGTEMCVVHCKCLERRLL
jgi:hypothetical protein